VEITLFADAKAIHFFDGGEFVSAPYTGTSAAKWSTHLSSEVTNMIQNYPPILHTVCLVSLRNFSPVHAFLTEEMNDVMFH
jgi:hypothetical protein